MVDYELNYEGILSVFCILFGIADLTRPQLPKCNNHLVSFIKVDGLSVSYIVDIFDTGPHGGFSVFLDFFGARRSFFRERRATRVPWRDLPHAALGL